MRTRCTNSNFKDWGRYGGRGITVCDRWIHSFENFLADMGERPEGMTLDRKDVNGNYEPGNCQWATDVKQSRNRRNSLMSEEKAAQARAMAASGLGHRAVADALGVPIGTIWHVLTGKTWRDEDAVG